MKKAQWNHLGLLGGTRISHDKGQCGGHTWACLDLSAVNRGLFLTWIGLKQKVHVFFHCAIYWHCARFMRGSQVTVSICSCVCSCVFPIIGLLQLRAAGLMLSSVQAEDIDRQRRAPVATSPQHGAAARRSAANVGGAMLTAELTRLYTCTDLFSLAQRMLSKIRSGPLSHMTRRNYCVWIVPKNQL